MYFRTTTTRKVLDYATQRKAESTLLHVSRGGIPTNPITLNAISENLLSGMYIEAPYQLLQDVKSDVALIAHVAKCLKDKASTDHAPHIHPLKQLLEQTDQDLTDIFSVPPNLFSKHKLSTANRAQKHIHRSTLIACSTAELIAHEAQTIGRDIDEEDAYLATALRRYGWQLIAWNYSDVMTRILRTSGNDEEEARIALRTVLGISPEEISRAFAKNWSLETSLRDSLQPIEENKKLSFQPERVQLTSRIAELASIYAESQTEKPTRRARDKWESSLDSLKRITPHLDTQTLNEQIEASVEVQLEKLNQATARTSVLVKRTFENAPAGRSPHSHDSSFQANKLLHRCSEELQHQLEEVYQAIEVNHSGEMALQTLISRAIPAAGFSRGVIYLLNQSQSKLVPAVTFGQDNILHDKISRDVIEASIDEAFQSEIPCHLQETDANGNLIEQVSASFGTGERPGVLILEVSNKLDSQNQNPLLHFKAIRQCLNDCLSTPRRT